jgi:L-lysine exporter family protein LysE/ArgO
VLSFLAIGFAIGVVTCIPIGVANVAVIDAAYRQDVARAIMVGLGGAIADGIYSAMGIFGVGPFLESYPNVPYVLYGVSGAALTVYGVITLRAQPMNISSDSSAAKRSKHHLRDGFALGLAATLLNPSAVVTWVVIVGSYATGIDRVQSAAWVIGIVVGSFVWFVVVAYLANHGKRLLSGNAIWMTRIAGIFVIVYGVFSVGRAVRYFLL